MRHTLLLSAILLSTTLFSQNVGIGTNIPAAKLDINSAHSGLLIPRIALTGSNDIATVPGAAISTLIYNTATVAGANAVSPGFYYWNGTIWVQIGSSNGGWQLTGNSGTTPGTNFIGTGDNQDLIMKVNNMQAGRLSTAGNTLYGVNAGVTSTGTDNVAMGSNALFRNTIGTELVAIGDSALFNVNSSAAIGNVAVGSRSLLAATSGHANTAVGFQTLMADNTGSSNTAMGFEALESNTTGASNVAIGSLALPNNTAGGSNIAIGANSMIGSTTGSNNISIGQNSMLSSTTGADNTSVGNSAQLGNTTGNSNTAIGTHALYINNGGSNFVAVGDSALYKQNGGTGGNTAVGSKALLSSTTGTDLTALGYHADVSTSGLNNATAIGANAVVASSNAMVLGGTGANAVNVGVGTSSPNASAVLDLTSTSQGFLIPRMTTAQMNAITTPADGLTVYNTDQQCTEMAIGGAWEAIACHCPAIAAIDSVRGPRGACPGYTVSYFVSPPIGASTYTWTVTAGPSAVNVPVNNQGSNPVNFTLPVSITSGTYTVSAMVSNACGTSHVTPAPAVGDVFTASSMIYAGAAANISNNAFTAIWSLSGVGGATYILLEVATDAGFTNLVYGFPYTLGLVDSFRVTGLTYNTTYYYRVAAGSINCSTVTAYSSGVSVTTVNHGTVTYNTPNSTHGGTPNVFTVPVGVTSLSVSMAGGNGGNLGYSYQQASMAIGGTNAAYYQGFGDIFTATLGVTPGQQLWVSAGANGTDASDNLTGTTTGGYGGISGDESGGNGAAGTEVSLSLYNIAGGQGGGGGGASDIRTTAGVRLIVAGGGGGAGYDACVFNDVHQGGGGYANSYGGTYSTSGSGTYGSTNIGGGGGTNAANGTGLTVTASGGPLCAASQASGGGSFAGGNGGTIHPDCSGTCYTIGGGGGGGGYRAGGGGDGGGGGGGASYTNGPGVSNVTFASPYLPGGFGGGIYPTNTAGGYVTLTW